MATIRFKRGTASQIQAAATGGTLIQGEPYLATDDATVRVGTGPSTLRTFTAMIVLGAEDDVPAGTPAGTVILREAE